MNITVLLSIYNGERFLKEQLDSILTQENVDVKILARIDGTHDNSMAILHRYQNLYPDKIEIMEGRNLGFGLSFTKLLEEAYNRYPQCQYFAFADQDDVWLPDKLITGINDVANQSSDIPVAYCSATRNVDKDLNPLGRDTVLDPAKITKPRALVQNFATGCTMVFNRKAVEIYIANEPSEIIVHDFLMYQICVFLGKVIYDTTPHILYRQHGSNQIGRPGATQRMKRRLKGNFNKHILENQNRNFYLAFSHVLCDNDKKLFTKFINYRSSMISRLKLLFDTKISRLTLEQNFFYRLKVILGGGYNRLYIFDLSF
ncbi:MAG: glycosyltransferase [Muribaculum sp.]|nr:glycosyltransferase [Muribaculum sp.]